MTSRIDQIGLNGGDGEHYFKREERYVVVKREDIATALTPTECNILEELLTKVARHRRLSAKHVHTKYVVISENWKPLYDNTWKALEEYVNEQR